jgi:nicotinate-nucleotide pyrophosphorylase (carboxylating)
MDRKKQLEKAFQRGHLLSLKNPLYRSWIERFIVEEVKGDVGDKGDITSDSVIKKNKILKATVRTREKGILAGVEETVFLYKKNSIKVNILKKDGDKIKKGDVLLELQGTEKSLLKIERSALDLLQRMSGIATLTDNLTKKTKKRCQIAPTRKTQWRYLDKKAVYIGGGLTHRLALWESILIKDNHLKALKREGIRDPVAVSLERAWQEKKKANFIEIETTDIKMAIKAASVFNNLQKDKHNIPCLIMLDNMPPKQIKTTIKLLKKMRLLNNVLLEASGKIDPNNIKRYAATGIDVISMGYLTHSSHAIDIKQFIL